MLVVVAHADVGAFGDDVNELGSVGVHTCVIAQIHQHAVSTQLTGQCVSELVRAAPAPPLVRDDAIDTAPVERNGTIKRSQQLGAMVGKVFGTDTPALLALREDVVRRYLRMQHVHKDCASSPVISAKARTIGIPLALSLPDLVGTCLTMHCVHMGYEQRAVGVVKSCVYMQVTHLVVADSDVLAFG